MSLEQDFLHGYEKHSKHFDKWCAKASTILGNVTQCGIVETDDEGNALIAINRPDFGELYIDKQSYLLDEHLTYLKTAIEGFKMQCSFDGVQFLQKNEKMLYGQNFDLWHGFTYTEKIDEYTQRQYYFGSDTPTIYDNLVNNLNLVKKLINQFKQDNEQIINYFRERKFNISEIKPDYFNNKNIPRKTEAENLTEVLHTLNVLDNNQKITNRELQCIQLYLQRKTAEQTGKALGISRRTVETHFYTLLRNE
jgi:DNA-binding CsgD family transcriptional regulator